MSLMHSVIETPIFTRRADSLLSREERTELIRLLAENPRRGDVIPGLGGVRKRLFENKSLIKNKKSFWVSPFFKKAASSEAFWKKLHQKLL